MNDHKHTDNDAENVFYSFDMREILYSFRKRDVIYGINHSVAVYVCCPTNGKIVGQTDNKLSQQGKVFGIYLSVIVDVAALIILTGIILVAEGNNTVEVAPHGRLLIQINGFRRNMQSAVLLVRKCESTLLRNRRNGREAIEVGHLWQVLHSALTYGSDAMRQHDRSQGCTAIKRQRINKLCVARQSYLL